TLLFLFSISNKKLGKQAGLFSFQDQYAIPFSIFRNRTGNNLRRVFFKNRILFFANTTDF
ncbi:hypothetical protein CH370_03810, partial [Leptospira kmetyi]|uniref:hypothetical protein n=1 Tax=Leptospira kmetyi TaxID=408139 RepID=UPI000CBFA913